MLDKLLERLEKEKKVIKGAPIHFTFVCILALASSVLLCFALFETALHLDSETLEAYQKRLDAFNSSLKESPSQSAQIMIYSNNPNTERLFPHSTNSAALAYGTNDTGPLYWWDTKTQSWK